MRTGARESRTSGRPVTRWTALRTISGLAAVIRRGEGASGNMFELIRSAAWAVRLRLLLRRQDDSLKLRRALQGMVHGVHGLCVNQLISLAFAPDDGDFT